MQVLTPNGYVHPSLLSNGAELCAFDLTTGAPIINEVENIDFVDYAEWCRWWKHEDTVPPFNWVRINDSLVLFREQNVWRNDGVSYTHARELEIGDKIYDDQDNQIVVNKIEEYEDRDEVWYRFDVTGDHSYILDGLTVHNASINWTAGPGSWTPSNTANWVGGVVPGSADVAVFPSGSGNCTLNFGGTITVQSVTIGAYNATWDNSVNNNNMTLSATAGLNCSGSGTRSIKLGTATYTLSNNTAQLNFTTTTGLTLTAGSSTITFSGATTGSRSFFGGAQTFGTVNFGACTGAAFITMTGGWNIGTCNYTAPSYIQFSSGTYTHNAAAYNGSPGSYLAFYTSSAGVQITIAASGSTFSWCSFRDINFTGSPTNQNCVDLGNNAGMTINPPQVIQPTYAAGI